jgi:hypothetical protein
MYSKYRIFSCQRTIMLFGERKTSSHIPLEKRL